MKQIRSFQDHVLSMLEESVSDIIKETLVDEELEIFLANLLHGKDHVMKNTEPVPEMDRVFSMCIGENVGPVFRGMYVPMSAKPGDRIVFDRYESFSESKEVAMSFTKNWTIMVATNAKNGFNYESYMSSLLKRMKRSDPEMFNMIDGPHLLGIVGFEKEWIFNIGSVFSVERVYERFNYKYIEGTIT